MPAQQKFALLPKLTRELMKSAKACGQARKHRMSRFVSLNIDQPASYTREHYRSRCIVCGLYVDVIPRPQPNEIATGGTAVALNCGDVNLDITTTHSKIETSHCPHA